jgi:CubicO group peptidase (beta-lactamase class C family)
MKAIALTTLTIVLQISLFAKAEQSELAATPQCKAFDKVVRLESADEKSGFQMDQIVVHKNGEVVYSWADGAYKMNSLHSLWSASKTVAATLAGVAIQQGRLSLESKVSEFFPKKFQDATQQKRYDAITIENLINMSSGFTWDESYESDPVNSSFIEMIYGKASSSMATFALQQNLEIEPGQKWNYSGGNANILMAILHKIYGDDKFPQNQLFKKLGITRSFFESDRTGTPIGSSYAYFTPEEFAKLGDFYLNNGVVNGERLLPENWIQQAQTLSNPLRLNRFSKDAKYKNYVKSEGAFSNRSFWLNQDIPNLDFKHEFPDAPANMFFAAGHYGQLLIMLPSQGIVIAATGHNKEYWSKIDKLVSNTLACFSPESNVKAGQTPPPADDASSSISKQLKTASGVLKKGYLQAIVSKEMCSCVYVSGLTLNQCLDHANLPMSRSQLNALVSIKEFDEQKSIGASPRILGELVSVLRARTRYGTYMGEEIGCKLRFP